MRYPSDVVDQVLNLSPDKGLLIWRGDSTHCSLCARPINDSDLYSPSALGEFFSDTRDLSCNSRIICWRCVALKKQALLFGLQNAVVTADGVFPVAKDVNKAWLFTMPPEGPMLITFSSIAMAQHLSWRTPITLSNQLLRVRFGHRLFTVRPSAINRALAIADTLNADSKQRWRSPLYLDRAATDESHGKLLPWAQQALDDESVAFLTSLSAGEYWALAYLMHTKRPVPEKPESITSTVLAKLNKTRS